MSSKYLLVTMLAIFASGCVSPGTEEQLETVDVNGETGYILRAGGAACSEDILEDVPFSQFEMKCSLEKVENGNHPAGLKYQTSTICPNGFNIIERRDVKPRPETVRVWSVSAEYIITCK